MTGPQVGETWCIPKPVRQVWLKDKEKDGEWVGKCKGAKSWMSGQAY